MIHPFELLGVPEDASPKEIKKAYYRLAQICHPDQGGSSEDMIALQKAYQSALGLQAEDARVGCPSMQSIREDVMNVDRKRIRALVEATGLPCNQDFMTDMIAYEFSYYYSTTGADTEPEEMSEFVEKFVDRYRNRQDDRDAAGEYTMSMADGYGKLEDEEMEADADAGSSGAGLILYESPFSASRLTGLSLETEKVKDFTGPTVYDLKQAYRPGSFAKIEADPLPAALDEGGLSAALERMRLEREQEAAAVKPAKLAMKWSYRLDAREG